MKGRLAICLSLLTLPPIAAGHDSPLLLSLAPSGPASMALQSAPLAPQGRTEPFASRTAPGTKAGSGPAKEGSSSTSQAPAPGSKTALETAVASVKHLQTAARLIKEGKYAAAEDELRAADALTPGYYNVLEPLSMVQHKQGKRQEALSTLERAIRTGKAFDDKAYLLAARLFSESKSYLVGEKALIEWAGSRPVTANFHAAIGILRLGGHDLGPAEIELRAALKADPANEAALTAMSQLYGHLEHYPRLQPFLDKAVAAKPDSVPILMLAGNSLLRQQRFAEARERFDAIVKLDPTNASAHVNLGSAVHGLGDAAGAIRSFRTAVEIDPKNTEAPVNLALALEADGKVREALDTLLAARARGLDNLDVLNALSLAYHLNGQDSEALAAARESLARSSNQPGVKTFIQRIESGTSAPR